MERFHDVLLLNDLGFSDTGFSGLEATLSLLYVLESPRMPKYMARHQSSNINTTPHTAPVPTTNVNVGSELILCLRSTLVSCVIGRLKVHAHEVSQSLLGPQAEAPHPQLTVATKTAFPLPKGPLCLTAMDHDPGKGKSTWAQ